MVSSITDSHSSNILAGTSPQQKTLLGSRASFTAQLTSALEGDRSISGEGSNLGPNLRATQSQDSGVRQFPATATAPDSVPHAAAPTAATTPDAPANSSGATFFGFVDSPAVAAPTTTTPNTSAGTSATDATPTAPPMSEVDAYWAAQPPAVQQLRDIPDLPGRAAVAQQLADQGFTIDKAIMVWGWDPLKTMLTRQAYGYTWAPSWNQGNVSTPGLALQGQTPYDPNNPPDGSIAVNTDFAKGTKISDPWSASQLKANT
jgi:hypothetical protein